MSNQHTIHVKGNNKYESTNPIVHSPNCHVMQTSSRISSCNSSIAVILTKHGSINDLNDQTLGSSSIKIQAYYKTQTSKTHKINSKKWPLSWTRTLISQWFIVYHCCPHKQATTYSQCHGRECSLRGHISSLASSSANEVITLGVIRHTVQRRIHTASIVTIKLFSNPHLAVHFSLTNLLLLIISEWKLWNPNTRNSDNVDHNFT